MSHIYDDDAEIDDGMKTLCGIAIALGITFVAIATGLIIWITLT